MISLKTRPVRPFEPSLDINPKFYRLQRIKAKTSFNRASFSAFRPEPNMMLYAYAPIQWEYNVQRRDFGVPGLGGVIPFPAANRDVIYQKPWSVSNSMDNISMSFNGYGFNYPNPRIWQKYLLSVFAKEEHMRKKFSPAGGPFPTYLGAYDEQAVISSTIDRDDKGINEATNRAFSHYGSALGDPSGIFRVGSLEPLAVGLFNPYEQKHDLPKWCWYKETSWLIPHVKQFNVDVQFHDLALGSFVYHYGRSSGVGVDLVLESNADIQNLSGEMILTWISPDAGYQIPHAVSLSSWNFRSFEFDVVGGQDIALGEGAPFDTGILQLQQVPTSLLIFASNDRDDNACFALASDTDGAGANQLEHFDNGPMEINLAIDNITISIEVNNKVIDSRFTKEQMYRITEQNCNDIPYGFSSWVGGERQFSTTPGNSFLYLRPQDLNIAETTGKLVTNFTFKVTGGLEGVPGYSFDIDTFGMAIPVENYKLYVYAFFDNYSVHLDPEGKVSANYRVHAI